MIDSVLKNCVAIIICFSAASCGQENVAEPPRVQSDEILVIAANKSHEVSETIKLGRLEIGEGAKLRPPQGKTVTLTVDGIVETIAAGKFEGDIVLTVADTIPVTYKHLPTHDFRAAVYIEDGKVIGEKSVAAAVKKGNLQNDNFSDGSIIANDENFNAVIVTGDSNYVIHRPTINLTGNGGNDFAGYGAAIMSSGRADVTVNHANITTKGAVRTAAFIGGDSTMRINHSNIDVYNGVLPDDYEFTIEVGKMFEVPWMLGLSGNVRAINLVDNGTLYIDNSHIRAEGWGALSTDDVKTSRMFVTNSIIETTKSGYGSYSIGDSHNNFSKTEIKVADIGLIIAGEASGTFTDETIVNSGRYGVMMHSGAGGGVLTIDKGSVVKSRSTAIQVKGRGTTILVDDAELNAENGVILQAMENDDPFLIALKNGPPPGAEGGPGGLPGCPDCGPPPPPPSGTYSPDVDATFRNISLNGDFYNARTNEGAMILSFENATVTGVISMATAAPASGKAPTQETYQEIGNVTNTAGWTEGQHGLAVTIDSESSWSVTGPSYLSTLNIAEGASIIGPEGRGVAMTVDGNPTEISPGQYNGAVLLDVLGSQ